MAINQALSLFNSLRVVGADQRLEPDKVAISSDNKGSIFRHSGAPKETEATLLPRAVTVPCVLNLEDDNRHNGSHHDRSGQDSR